MNSLSDTILAVATPAGRSARAVLRLSGSRALEATEAASGNSGRVRSRPGYTGTDVDFQLDSGIATLWVDVFRAPYSYTREHVVEVHVPAAPPLVEAVARALVIQEGVRWAGPGEFTLRAFLNGRIDLSQAEAVAQLIAAVDEREARAARRGLEGQLGRESDAVARHLTETLALVEASLDFADEGLREVERDEVKECLDKASARLVTLRQSTQLRLSAPGSTHVVLGGFPNAGKSSLLNALLGRQAALVSPLGGTTRDPVRGVTQHQGARIEWVDLAGSFSVLALVGGAVDGEAASSGAPDAVVRRPLHAGAAGSAAGPCPEPELDRPLGTEAQAAVRRLSRIELENADVVLWVVDPLDRPQAALDEFSLLDARRRVLVVNKTDLLSPPALESWRRGHAGVTPGDVYLVSARTGAGVDDLVRGVVDGARGRSGATGALSAAPRFIVSAHQESALVRALEALERASAALAADVGYEFLAADLRDSLRALEELVGKVSSDQILGHIFARFCVGK